MARKLEELMVLIVEPSTTQRKIIAHYLNNLGIEKLTYADTGALALAQMQDYPPDLVISALYLPDTTGTELIKNIREDEGLKETAFMLISSETRFRYLDPIRQAGVTAILPKPFSQQELLIALNTTLDYYDTRYVDLDNFDPENIDVLIVDDSRMARNHIRRVLQNMGIERFTEAVDGIDALKQLSTRFFDLIITDYNMPKMDGKELIERIRSNTNQSSIPILMVTSEENNNRLAAVQNAGVSAVCDKPFEPATVRALIQQVFA
ncbi:MAG: two-component system response regulator [Sedimenticola sp.]|nr:MAG: two-component system response regulator [Sedimenticola sp.]